MTWDAFHHRGEVLRTVIETADARHDGLLPMDLPGVVETFRDEATLLGALHLRWFTRLSGQIERALMADPAEPESAVIEAWRRTGRELPGVRLILDRYAAAPTSPAMGAMLEKAHRKEWAMLGALAGRASAKDERGVAAGRQLEETARAALTAA